MASSGGYAEYATLDAATALPIPPGVSFAEATTLTIQGLTAYALLKFAARPRPDETVLVQASAGGVGLFLVQLAKLHGAGRVIALASSREKLDLVRRLGARCRDRLQREGLGGPGAPHGRQGRRHRLGNGLGRRG